MNLIKSLLGVRSPANDVLLSKDSFSRVMIDAVARAEAERSHFSVLEIALDSLTLIQDGFGELARDKVIKHASVRLLHVVGTKGQVALDAEGKFLVLLRGNASVSQPISKNILAALSEQIDIGGHLHKSKCSIGIAVYPKHGPDALMLSHASLARRIAAQRGSDQICLYDEQHSTKLRDEALLVMELSQAIANRELSLYFQPKIDANSMQVTSAEALLRWQHPKRGFISPMVFIPLAEKYQLMGSIGAWVVEEACLNAAEWRKRGLHMRVAVNISVYQMHQADFVAQILSKLSQYGLEPERFTCEITETAAMEDAQATRDAFEKMKQAGLHVSIDDFGTGYSSLAVLRRMHAAELKIDMEFVKDLEGSLEARLIAKSIIDMAKALHLRVVAEGVETEAQSDLLVQMGCDELQGYLFSVPITADALQSMADNHVNTGAAKFRNSLFANDFNSL